MNIKKVVNFLSRVEPIPKRKFTPVQIVKSYKGGYNSKLFRSTDSWVGDGYCFIKEGFLREKLLERIKKVSRNSEFSEYYEEGYTKLFEDMVIRDDGYQLFPLGLLPIKKEIDEIGDCSEPLILLDKKKKNELVIINMRYFKLFVDNAPDKKVEFYQKEDVLTGIEVRFDGESIGYVMPNEILRGFKELSRILLRRLRRKFDV